MNIATELLMQKIRKGQLADLRQLTRSTLEGLEQRVRIDNVREGRFYSAELEETAGAFAAASLHLDVLGALAKKSVGRGLEPARRNRIETLVGDLHSVEAAFVALERAPFIPCTDMDTVIASVKGQLAELLRILQVLKLANRELHPDRYSSMESATPPLQWSALTPRERSGLPLPLLVVEDFAEETVLLVNRLFSNGLPFRMVIERSRLVGEPAPWLETFPLIWPSLYLLQSAPVLDGFASELEQACSYGGAVILSIPAMQPNEDPESFADRQRRLVRCGCFLVVKFVPSEASLSAGFECPEGLPLLEEDLHGMVKSGDAGPVDLEQSGDLYGTWLANHTILRRRLRQLAGIENSDLVTAVARAREELSQQHKEELMALKKRMEAAALAQQQQAVQDALSRIAHRLVG
jgi:hypothetical protein